MGDRVVATNPVTFETVEKEVVECYRRETGQLVHLAVNGEEITTTVNHPFYVRNRGFVAAGGLQEGDELVTAGRGAVPVEAIRVEVVEQPEVVYNFQVADFHTYYVGSVGVLVHNAECGVSEGGAVPVVKTQKT